MTRIVKSVLAAVVILSGVAPARCASDPASGGTASAAPAKAQAPLNTAKMASFFNAKCAACHTIGHGDRVGPDLKGVLSRHSKKWLAGYIANPDAYFSKDPDAQALLKKYHGMRMPNPKLSSDQIENILRYFATVGGEPKPATVSKAKATPSEPVKATPASN
jgi:mono/diheme cytochrome c family protein